MSRRAFTDAGALLNDLLDRLETRPDSQRLFAHVDAAAFESVRQEVECVACLDAAERSGGIRIVRDRLDGVERIRHVALANPAALYAHLSRVPSKQQVEDALGDVWRGARPEVRPLIEEIAEAWRRKVGRFGLPPGAVRNLELTLKLVDALQARAADPGIAEVDYRTFSRSSAGDSKALERLKTPALGILRRISPVATPAHLDDAETLSSLGVIRIPQPFLVGGPVAIGGPVLFAASYVGVPPEEAAVLTLVRRVTYVLVIENFTSFVRHVREINPGKSGLVIYGGGFPSRAALRAIVRLASLAQAPTFHWGDMDLGGLNIFRHVEAALAAAGVALRPHLMDKEMLAEGQPRTTGGRLARGGADGSAIAELWDAMALDPLGRGLEQEATDPRLPA